MKHVRGANDLQNAFGIMRIASLSSENDQFENRTKTDINLPKLNAELDQDPIEKCEDFAKISI